MPKSKIAKNALVPSTKIVAVVFGTDRIASIWGLRNAVARSLIVLATHPEEVAKITAPVMVVRVSKDAWKPSTFPDEVRVRETEQLLKKLQTEEVMMT